MVVGRPGGDVIEGRTMIRWQGHRANTQVWITGSGADAVLRAGIVVASS